MLVESLAAQIKDETMLKMRLAGMKVEEDTRQIETTPARFPKQDVPEIDEAELAITADDIMARMASFRDVPNVTNLDKAFHG